MCVDKYDLNEDNTHQIESYFSGRGIEIVPRIPFDNIDTEALVQGLPVVEYSPGKVTQEIGKPWQTVTSVLDA